MQNYRESGKGKIWALPAVVCGATGIAFAPIFVRLSEVGPIATAFWRITLALPVLWVWMAWESIHTRRKNHEKRFRFHPLLFVPGLFFAGDLAVWHFSIKFTTVANATLLANLAPIFVTLAAWRIFHERISKRFLFGMAIAVTGTMFLMSSSFKLQSRYLAGDALGILTALFYAGYILTVNRLRSRFSTARIMSWGGLCCSVVLLPLALFSEESLLAGSLHGWMVLLGLALISQVGGQGLIAFSLAYLPAPFASVSLLLQPVLAAIFAWIILKEGIGFFGALGGVVILTGIYLARKGSVKE